MKLLRFEQLDMTFSGTSGEEGIEMVRQLERGGLELSTGCPLGRKPEAEILAWIEAQPTTKAKPRGAVKRAAS